MDITPNAKQWAEKIGQQLRSHRKAQGLSLKDLSRLSGSTLPTLSHIERGTRDVKLSTLVALANALRIDLYNLFADHPQSQHSDTTSDAQGYRLDDD